MNLLVDRFAAVCAARLPLDNLGLLAGLRTLPGLQVRLTPEHAWLRWEAGAASVLQTLLPVAGVVLYERRDSRWHCWGAHLPAPEGPEGDFKPLRDVLVPAAVVPLPPASTAWSKPLAKLVPDATPRATSAMLSPYGALARWADTAATSWLADCRAAHCGGQALILGQRLPLLPAAQRLWGQRLLRPLGFRIDPDLPESALCAAMGAADNELIVWGANGPELLSEAALEPLTRAGLRRAAEGMV